MNKVFRTFLVSLICGSIVILSGCGPKELSPYSPGSKKNMPEGKDIEYASRQAGMISEEIGPSVDTLDSTGVDSLSMANQDSDEYKRLHGRSTPGLEPIYFDFDQAAIRSDQSSSLEANASYMSQNPSAQLVIEGNCDERGTNEYNLALGERRALNAKNYLIELGVEEYRLRTVSYGEERPLFSDSDEFSWGQNRRADFIAE